MDKINLTLLEINQIFGNRRLKIFEKRGAKATITDFAILNKGYVSSYDYSGEANLENRTGIYWAKTDDGCNDVRAVASDGYEYCYYVRNRIIGTRPALPFSLIVNHVLNKVKGIDGILEVEWGEYPQKVASKEMQLLLEDRYHRGSLQKTGKCYTADKTKHYKFNQSFDREEIEEYEYQRKKYVRVIANTCYDGDQVTLSDGQQFRDGDAVWVEVSPMTWWADEENDIAITKDIVFAGVRFNRVSNYKGDFETTDMYKYLNNYLIKELIPNKIQLLNKEYVNEELRKTCIKLISFLGKRTLQTNAEGILEDLELTEIEQRALAQVLLESDEDVKVIDSFMAQVNGSMKEVYDDLHQNSKTYSLTCPGSKGKKTQK